VGRPRGIFLKPGDRVRVTIAGIGALENPVIDEA
jgi:2-keto-4-pentenoate hydratase/2-oxohepta-3-ene-1,7-dioic acid hydratase in catechol pathway